MILSLSGFLFEDNYETQSLPLGDFCELASSAGCGAVELRDTQVSLASSAAGRRDVLRTVDDAGLFVSCLTARGMPSHGVERDAFFRRYLDLCTDLDCSLLKISSDTGWLHDAAETALDAGVRLATNNHLDSPLETVGGTRDYFRAVDHANMGLLYDSQHLYVAGEDYMACLEEFADRTWNVLVHSVRRGRPSDGETRPRFVRGGVAWYPALPDDPAVQDWRAVMAALRRRGYDGLITVFESAWPIEMRQDVARRSATYLGALWEDVG